MSNTRRSFFSRFALGAGVFAAQHIHLPIAPVPVETPDVARLPFKVVDDAKEFHIVAEPVHTRFLPDREVDAPHRLELAV